MFMLFYGLQNRKKNIDHNRERWFISLMVKHL